VSYCSIRDITRACDGGGAKSSRRADPGEPDGVPRHDRLGRRHEVNNPNNLIMFNAPMILAAWETRALAGGALPENGDFPLGVSRTRDAEVSEARGGISSASSRSRRS